MPPGITRTQPPVKVAERATAEACLAIAQRVARAHYLADDRIGWSAAAQVARSIEEELLGRACNLKVDGMHNSEIGAVSTNRYKNPVAQLPRGSVLVVPPGLEPGTL